MQLREAGEKNDVAEIERLAHKYAGSSGTIGAKRMHQLLYTLEREARGGKVESFDEFLVQIEAEYANFLAAAERELSDAS